MFEKSIIYLLFPTLFSSFAISTSTPEKEHQQMSNQEIIEQGVEKVKGAFEAINFEELNNIIKEAPIFRADNTKNKADKIPTNNKNKCVNKTQEDFCLN